MEAIRAAEHPRSVLGWLTSSPAAPLLSAMIDGSAPREHHTLDVAAAGKGGRAFAVEHLRRLLIAAGALADRDEHLHRASGRLDALIATAHPDDKPVLRSFAAWHLLRKVRVRSEQGKPTRGSADWVSDTMAEATRFLADLRRAGQDLAGCTQAEIDHWLAERPPAVRHLPTFVTWAVRHQHAARGLTLTRPVETSQRQAQPSLERWDLAQRLLSDEAIADGDRVAGLLILLYGQTSSRISWLQRQHVTVDPARDDAARLRPTHPPRQSR